MRRRLRNLWLLGLLILLLAPAAAAASPSIPDRDTEAREVIERFTATILDSMRRGAELGYAGRYKLFEAALQENFALPFMARVSLGKYWDTLDQEQKKVLLQDYTAWSVASYAGQFDSYSGQKFDVLPEVKSIRDTLSVTAKLIRKDGDVIDFDYLLSLIDGRMQIVDIKVSGVSQLALTRAQFVAIMKRDGLEGLISTLQQKTADFAKGKE